MPLPDLTRLDLPGASLPGPGDLRLTDVLGALVACLDPKLPGARPEAAEHIGLDSGEQALVVMVDGLGLVPLREHYGHAPTLRRLRSATLHAHTVAPSTTAAGITALATGAYPGATRMVGYSVAHGSGVMNLLAFEGGPDPRQWQPVAPIFERLDQVGVASAVVSPPSFAGSGLTRAALRGARHVPAVSWEDRCAAALRELRAGTPLVYLYWSDIDHAGHGHGLASNQWVEALEHVDAGLASLLRRLPSRVRAVLTADHGMVDVRREDLTDVAATPELAEGVRIIAGETRAVHVHCEPGRADEVEERWRAFLGEEAWVVSGPHVSALLGPGPGCDQVGDFLVHPRGRRGVVDSRTQSEGAISLVGVHGSLTEDEMLVPVVRLA
ncbi:alkaline phosphatase family protein [Schaalia sp. 19OD2882]|nr:alkaline phosphatase family protein [Schaalia sp. 19OD2882]